MLNIITSLKSLSFIAILVISLAFHGCSESTIPYGSVTGTITFDGKPLSDIVVVCQPLDQKDIKSAQCAADKDGKFTLITSSEIRGVPIGKCDISITLPELAEGAKLPEILTKIPPKYFEPFQQAEIKSGSNTIELKLVTK